MNYKTIAALAAEIHAPNIAAGWWPTPYPTGKDLLGLIIRKSNLIQSEAAEATEAHRKNTMDDHLPDVHGVVAEMADVGIRCLDMIGFIGATIVDISSEDFGGAAELIVATPDIILSGAPAGFAIEALIASIHATAHNAMADLIVEGDAGTAALTYVGIITIAERVALLMGADFDDVIAMKRAYNAQRADHKIENRKAAGGKSY
jgi:hypothetical protein